MTPASAVTLKNLINSSDVSFWLNGCRGSSHARVETRTELSLWKVPGSSSACSICGASSPTSRSCFPPAPTYIFAHAISPFCPADQSCLWIGDGMCYITVLCTAGFVISTSRLLSKRTGSSELGTGQMGTFNLDDS